jgi:hypothetical protein
MDTRNKWLVTAKRYHAIDLCYISTALIFCGLQFGLYFWCAEETCLGFAVGGPSQAAAVMGSMGVQGIACLFVVYIYRVKYKEEHNPYAAVPSAHFLWSSFRRHFCTLITDA